MATASVVLLTMARTADNDSMVKRLIDPLLLELRQRLRGLVLVGIVAARADHALEVRLGELGLSHLLSEDAGVVLDLGIARLLGRTLLDEGPGPLVDTALVEDPPERVGDERIVGRAFLGDRGELERTLLVAGLREHPGQVVGGGHEAG